MLNSGKKNRALHDKKNKYSNSRVVRKIYTLDIYYCLSALDTRRNAHC